MNKEEEKIYADVLADHDYVVKLRRYFHTYPELSAQEEKTAQKIEAELDALGLKHHRIAKTGVYTEIQGNKEGNKTIVLRADIDALPLTEKHECAYKSTIEGRMHACGHDAHTAALLGAARVLVKNRDLFGGKVILTFQPGEEIGYGARIIINEGAIDGADRTFGIHMASNVPVGSVVVMPGPNNASVDQFKITVHGKSAHISTPELGVDAAYVASMIVTGVQALVTKRTNPMDNVLIGIGRVAAGTTYNIIAGEAEIEGTVRVFSPEIRDQIQRELKQLAEKTAEAYGASITYWNRDNTSPLINDPVASAEAQKTASALFGKEHVITSRTASLGGDDFAEYILKVPGVYAYVGSANPEIPETTLAHHDNQFDIDEDALSVGCAIYAAYAVDFLNGNV